MEARDVPAVALLFDQYRQFYEQSPDLARAQRFVSERFERNESVVLVAQAEDEGIVGFC